MQDRKRQDKQDRGNYPAYPAACDHAYPVPLMMVFENQIAWPSLHLCAFAFSATGRNMN